MKIDLNKPIYIELHFKHVPMWKRVWFILGFILTGESRIQSNTIEKGWR